ncbi:hypothetical protein MTO96_022220 [Rhipicephalus appendiculatus]
MLSGTPARLNQKPSVRILLAMLHFLFFVISYCFTGGYISFLNMPIREEAPDTKEKLLTVLRTGRLRACIWGNSFGNATIAKSRTTYISQLRAAVRKQSPFIADSLDICAERTRRREAVLFTSMHVLEWYEQAFRGQVEISRDFWLGFRPISYVLPRASPYENAVQNAVMRTFESGLFNEFERRYRDHYFPAPKNLSTKDPRRVLKMKDFKLPFIILAGGLWSKLIVSEDVTDFIVQVMTGILNASHVEVLTEPEADTNMTRSRKLSMRIVMAMLHVLCFVVSYCFTGGYISFLNLPLYEEAPDTVDKVLTAFTEGRLEPCIWKNSFVNVSLVNPKSGLMSRLRDSVADWTPFMLEDMDECAERTRRRQAVFIEGILYQKRYAYSMRGQVQVSTDTLQDFVFMCYFLPKASPYEDLIENAIMRMFEAGLFKQFEHRYRYLNLSAPNSFPTEDIGRDLQIESTTLPFCCLAMKTIWTHLVHSRWVILDVRGRLKKFLLNQTPCTFYAVTKTAQNPFSTTIKQLHDSVPDWSPFLADSMQECVQRTVRRQAVMFSSLQNLERYAYSHRGFVQISQDYIHDFTPMGYVLPKASPYKEVLQNMQMEHVWTRMVYSYWIVLGRDQDFASLILQQKPCTFYLITEATKGYVLQGPSYAKRNNCSGVVTIAQWPKPHGDHVIDADVTGKGGTFRCPCAFLRKYRATRQKKEPSVVLGKKVSVRILLVTLQLLLFIFSYCFTGGYISFLNRPILEEVPDTKEKLLAMLRMGRLQPCVSNNSFSSVIIKHSENPSLSELRNTVKDWAPFIAEGVETCVERTTRREAVFITATHTLEECALVLQGHVQISRAYAHDLMFESSYLLPKASPYKELVHNM